MTDAGPHGPTAHSTGGVVPGVDVESPTGPSDQQPSDEQQLEGRRASLWADAWRQLRRDPVFVVAALILILFSVMAMFPQLFTSTDPITVVDLGRSAEPPSAEHWFGLDVQGRDYYARVIYGARVSMIIGLLVVFGAGVVALIFGSLSGYYGGPLDAVLSRITDIWFGIPLILAALVFLQVVDRGLFEVSAVLIVFGWPTMMRIVRSSVLSEREREYVIAARALGAGDARIILRHILPNAIAPVIVYGTILVGIIITLEATLSFLGAGLQLPAISWGLEINTADTRVLRVPHLLIFPGAFLAMTVFGFILLGDALRDALDPRLR